MRCPLPEHLEELLDDRAHAEAVADCRAQTGLFVLLRELSCSGELRGRQNHWFEDLGRLTTGIGT